jgi:hypothetical protein
MLYPDLVGTFTNIVLPIQLLSRHIEFIRHFAVALAVAGSLNCHFGRYRSPRH